MLVHGSCHCGNIAFDLAWEPEPREIAVRACGCTFCLKHGGIWTSNPGGKLDVSIARPSDVSRYAFGTRTATFHICTTCGAVPLVTSEIEGRLYAVVSANAFDNVDPALLRRAPASFDGETVQARLERRKRNWIARVEFVDRRA